MNLCIVMDALFWVLTGNHCDFWPFLFLFRKAYSCSQCSLILIFVYSFWYNLFPCLCTPVTHTTLNEQCIRLTNGIIYQFQTIISCSLSFTEAAHTAPNASTGKCSPYVLMNSWAQSSSGNPKRSHVEWSEGLVSEPSGSCLLICLSSGSL